MKKITMLVCALLLGLLSYAQGHENFDNFDHDAGSYQDGSFEGQDGSTWEYIQARGDLEINGKAIGLHKNGNDAELTSGTISGGMGTLEFSYMQAFSNDVDLDVYVNDDLVYTATSNDEQNDIKESGEIEVNVEGDIILKFKNENGAQVAIDDIIWTAYEDDTPGGGSGDTEECSQELAGPEEVEDGYGNLHLLQVANDLIIDANGTFELQAVDFNALIEPGLDIDGVQLYFYDDSGDGPGNLLGSTEMITPTDIEDLGEAFDFDRVKVSIDLEEPFLFNGSPTESAVWIGVTIDYMGDSSFMEMQNEMVYGTESYLYNEDFDEWVAGSIDFGEAGEGIISFYGECGELEDCSGDPEAGEINADESFAVCPGESFTLTVDGYTQAAGITFQWQESNDGGDTWTNIEGEDSPALSFPDGLEEETDFRFTVTCEFSDSSDTTDPVSITINSYEDCYCIPDMFLGCEDDMIDDFTLEGENDTAIEDLNTGCSPEGYEDHTDLSVDLGLTGQYDAYITTPADGDLVAVWIDFNDNGVFDADELVGIASNLTPGAPSPVEISIPEDAELGEHRMRVMLGWSLEGNPAMFDPCNADGGVWFGETHDYTVNIVQEMSVDNQIFEDFSFYPNPVENQLNLNANAQIESVEIFNLLGQSVIKENPNTVDIQLNTQALQTGVYMMKVTIDGSQKTFKIVKK